MFEVVVKANEDAAGVAWEARATTPGGIENPFEGNNDDAVLAETLARVLRMVAPEVWNVIYVAAKVLSELLESGPGPQRGRLDCRPLWQAVADFVREAERPAEGKR